MDLRLLRSFVTLADIGHYGRAASALCITQPTLTKQIQQLESLVGSPLFTRGRQGAIISTLGAILLNDARHLIHDLDAVILRARQSCLGERGLLRVGFGLSALEFAPRAIAAFRQIYPLVDVVLNDYSSTEQTYRLRGGEQDVGFVRLPCADGLAALPLFDEQLSLCLPLAAPWQEVPMDLAELNQIGFVALSPARGPGLAAQIQHWCDARGFLPRIVQYADDILTVHAIVSAGLGASLLPFRAAKMFPPRARFLPLDGEAARWKIGLVWKEENPPAIVRRFADFVHQMNISVDLPCP